MRCTDARAVMMELLDDLADSAQQAALLSHVAECAACRAEWRALQELDALLTAAPMAVPPPDFTQRVLTRVRTSVSPPSQTLWETFPGVHPLGGIAVLMLGGMLLFTTVAAPLLQRLWPTIWGLFTGFAGAGSAPLVSNPMLIGVGETLQALWRLHRSLLQSVGPLLLAGYFTMTIIITLVWLRLVMGMQQALRLRQ